MPTPLLSFDTLGSSGWRVLSAQDYSIRAGDLKKDCLFGSLFQGLSDSQGLLPSRNFGNLIEAFWRAGFFYPGKMPRLPSSLPV